MLRTAVSTSSSSPSGSGYTDQSIYDARPIGRVSPAVNASMPGAFPVNPDDQDDQIVNSGQALLLTEYQGRGMITAEAPPYVKVVDMNALCMGKEIVTLEKTISVPGDTRIRNGETIFVIFNSNSVLRGSPMTKYLKWAKERDMKARFVIRYINMPRESTQNNNNNSFIRLNKPFVLESVSWPRLTVGKCLSPPWLDTGAKYDSSTYMGCLILGMAGKTKGFIDLTFIAESTTLVSRFPPHLRGSIVAGHCNRCQTIVQGPMGSVARCPSCTAANRLPVIQNSIMSTTPGGFLPNAYSCPHCSAFFTDPTQLIRHAETAHQMASSIPLSRSEACCPHCPAMFQDPVQLLSHVERYHSDKLGVTPGQQSSAEENTCPTCGEVFVDAIALVSHVEQAHETEPIGPEPTNDTVFRAGSNRAITTYSCPECGSMFADDIELVTHFETAHPAFATHRRNSVTISCPHCELKFDDEAALVAHVEASHQREMQAIRNAQDRMDGRNIALGNPAGSPVNSGPPRMVPGYPSSDSNLPMGNRTFDQPTFTSRQGFETEDPSLRTDTSRMAPSPPHILYAPVALRARPNKPVAHSVESMSPRHSPQGHVEISQPVSHLARVSEGAVATISPVSRDQSKGPPSFDATKECILCGCRIVDGACEECGSR